MRPSWKQIYPWIEAAVINLESTDVLLQQVTGCIAITYRADCLIWVGLSQSPDESPCVYATPRVARQLQQNRHFVHQPLQTTSAFQVSSPKWQQSVQKFHLLTLPDWLQQQQQSPKVVQLTTGDLVIPVTQGGHPALPTPTALRFVIQLHRPTDLRSPNSAPSPSSHFDLAAQVEADHTGVYTGIPNWSPAEIFSLEVVCSQLTLAYNALYWRQRLEQARQQTALMGRISQLLNSSLNPDDIVKRILAELGQGLNSDRILLVDLRQGIGQILGGWTHPERAQASLLHPPDSPGLWAETIEMFTLGGASYLELDLSQDQTGNLQEWLRQSGGVAALMVPLSIQEEFFGVVLCLSHQSSQSYPIDQLQTLRQVADQVAIALRHAQSYQSLWMKHEARRIQSNALQLEIIQDDLTQLLNRHSLEHELDELSAPALWALHPTFAIILCDIDYFQLVNDSYGYVVGDEILREMARRIQRHLRQGTSAYRYGGEEFAVILTETSGSAATDVAKRLQRAIRSEPFATQAGPVKITASFGVAQQDLRQDQDARSVFQRSDRALQEAKRQGRDRVVTL